MNTNEQKINKLKALLDVANQDFATKEEIAKTFVEIIKAVKSIKESRDEKYDSLLPEINALITEHKRLSEREDYSVNFFKQELRTLKNVISDLKLQKGEDGKDANEVDTAQIALEASKRAIEAIKPLIPSIPSILEEMPVLGEKVRDSLELLVGEERLDAKAIKNLPSTIQEGVKYYGGSGIKEVIAGTGISVDNSNLGYPVISAPGATTDEKVKYDALDASAGYLGAKTVAGTGISLSEGTGGDVDKLKITNSAPDQTVAITDSGIAVVTGTYPNFNIDVPAETDPLSLHLNQTGGPQSIINGVPLMTAIVDGMGSEDQLINKKYLDLALEGLELTLFLSNNALSPVLTNFYSMSEVEDATATITGTALGDGLNQLDTALQWATPTTLPHLTTIYAGIYNIHFHTYYTKSGGSPIVTAYFKLFYCEADGSGEIQIGGDSESFPIPFNNSAPFSPHLVVTNDVAIEITKRLKLKAYINVTVSGGQTITTFVEVGGTKDSHLSLKVPAIELSNIFVPYTGATQNVDLGSKTLTTTGIGSFGSLVTTVGGLKLLAGQDIRPSADSTTAINIAQADGTDFVTFDTTNKRVGIGTTSPNTPLHLYKYLTGVVNQLTLENLYSAATSGNGIFLKGYYNHALISSYENASNVAGGNLQLQTYSDDNTLNTGIVLNRLGNVGIGTVAPAEVLNTNHATRNLFRTDIGGSAIGWIGNSNSLFTGTLVSEYGIMANTKLHLGSNGGTLGMTISAGNVGIGTTSPQANLDINSGPAAVSIKIADTYGGFTFSRNQTTGGLEIQGSQIPSNNIVLAPTSGNVGIGTTAPLRRLDINEASGNCLRLIYNDADGSAANYADFLVSSAGGLTITPSGGTATFGTSTALGVGSIELGHASDTSITRVGAGAVDIEGKHVVVNASTSTDNAAARYDSTTGAIVQDSPLIIGDVTSKNAILDFAQLASTDKTFTFPNETGTLAVGTPWTTWTPTFANFTKGSATIVARYTMIGKTVHYRLSVTLAADSSMGTTPTYSLPVTAISSYSTFSPIGHLKILDNTTNVFSGTSNWASTTTASIDYFQVSGTSIASPSPTATAPMTWTTNDGFFITGSYEAA